MRTTVSGSMLVLLLAPAAGATAQTPNALSHDAMAVDGRALLTTIHAQGAQVYECKTDTAGKLAWQFREPIATLIADGKTVGRHFAGPSWQLADGSAVTGKVVARGPGATAGDIPQLRLDVTQVSGTGQLAAATTILRINTKGGIADGPCERAGTFLSAPYSADYAFYGKHG